MSFLISSGLKARPQAFTSPSTASAGQGTHAVEGEDFGDVLDLHHNALDARFLHRLLGVGRKGLCTSSSRCPGPESSSSHCLQLANAFGLRH